MKTTSKVKALISRIEKMQDEIQQEKTYIENILDNEEKESKIEKLNEKIEYINNVYDCLSTFLNELDLFVD